MYHITLLVKMKLLKIIIASIFRSNNKNCVSPHKNIIKKGRGENFEYQIGLEPCSGEKTIFLYNGTSDRSDQSIIDQVSKNEKTNFEYAGAYTPDRLL